MNGGGGADVISAAYGSGSAVFIYGDTLSSDYYGNDTINLSGTTFGVSGQVAGGGGADSISFLTGLGGFTGSTIAGGGGKDIINVEEVDASAHILIEGGAGADTINMTSDTHGTGMGTIDGGAGADVINVSAHITGASAAFIKGGAGADSIGLGGLSTSQGTGGILVYGAFSESNTTNMDVISATVASGTAFTISQSAVSGTVATSYGNADFTTDEAGLVTWVSAAGNDVTARAEQLDKNLALGKTVVFADNANNDYLFIQGGAQDGGLSDDMLVQIPSATISGSGMTYYAGTSIAVNLA